MNLPQEKLNEIKAAHPGIWAEKKAAGLNDQLVASAILNQLAHDAEHPPEAEALRRVKAAADIVQAMAGRLITSRQDLERLVAEVREKFPGIRIEIAEEHPALAGAAPDVEALRKELEEARACNRDLLVKKDELSAAVIAAQGAKHEALAAAEKHLADLKAAQDLLKQAAACASIKEVRELLKPVESQPAGTPGES